MTSNTELRAEICELLLTAVGLCVRWTAAGPPQQLAAERLSPEQGTMVGIANAIWDETVQIGLSEVWNELAPDRVSLIGTLLVASAYGDQGLVDWLSIQVDQPRGEKRNAVH